VPISFVFSSQLQDEERPEYKKNAESIYLLKQMAYVSPKEAMSNDHREGKYKRSTNINISNSGKKYLK
jgi:hypothetical protein